MNEEHHDQYKFLSGFFIGGLIGALIIFFLGTKEGKKVGKVIEKKGEDVLDDLEDKVEDLKDKGKELLEKGEEIKERVLAQLNDKKEDLTGEAVKRLDSALAHVEKVQEKGLSATSGLRKHFKNLPKGKNS